MRPPPPPLSREEFRRRWKPGMTSRLRRQITLLIVAITAMTLSILVGMP